MVLLTERIEMADTFEHYAAVTDAPDRDRWVFRNKMERVIGELWDFYKIEEGYEDRARQVACTACHKLVKDMMYEARTQAIVDFHAAVNVKVKRKEATTMTLTKEEYLESAAHGGEPINTFEAFALSHNGKAEAEIHYNPEDPPEAYSNPSVYSRLSSYSEVAKEVYGQDYDPRSHDLDGEVVMRAGKGKKHGRYYLGDSVIDTASTPTLSQIRARTVSGGPSIRERPTATQALQAQLEEERARREHLEASLAQ
ncbi:hypothetical protein EJB05_31351 [Eragrostis curvula]|uniref:Uncharacterized protein n=1 Tax=Eragrostis curvula TaxID=38414 RepID=A0A5J9UEZ2_9POAL|nr:hypothetical protein EJB05_31351 [Eragrostis curvula]